MAKPLKFSYDAKADILTVEGVKFAGDLFRTLAFPRIDRLYRFSRERDSVMVRDCGEAK